MCDLRHKCLENKIKNIFFVFIWASNYIQGGHVGFFKSPLEILTSDLSYKPLSEKKQNA